MNMSGIRLFKIGICDSSGALVEVEGGRSFDDVDRPFYLAVHNFEWAMTLGEAGRLAGAARRAEYRMIWAREHGTPAKAGPLFRRELQLDDEVVEVEIGIADGGEVYFTFGEIHASEQGLVLVHMLGRFADEASNIRRASGLRYDDPAHGWPILGLRQIWRR
jgi:hypothetical protein